mmetsp:Transcript_20553/g.22911  ORF Transcript_20553/g.22911 Transcript_20553/m.22911 type:complete len:234 (+) Transcript_20553:104-805(+)
MNINILREFEEKNWLLIATSMNILFLIVSGLWFYLFVDCWMIQNILMTPSVYYIPTIANAINIIVNIIAKSALTQNIPSMILNSIFIGLFPFTKMGTILFAEGFDNNWLIKYAAINAIVIAILFIQDRFGSRFFLPSCLRTRVYNKFLKNLKHNSPEVVHTQQCELCLNDLADPGLEYSDADKSYTYKRFEPSQFMVAPCGHKFHPNCLLKLSQKDGKCLICYEALPADYYDD